ncbi:MAG: YIP1 family protein [Bacteriovoracaceae bacterium]|nr:YIP1 family protein [Bacteroidota bacterium]
MPEEIKTPEPSTEMSWSDKFVGILSSPGEVYQSIIGTEPKQSNWAIPLILTIIVGIVFTFTVFTQPAIQDQLSDAQHQALQKSVAEGKMTQEQVDSATENNLAKPGSPMFLIFGSIVLVIVLGFSLVAYSTVYFSAGKMFLKSTVTFSKILEVYGLSFFVSAVVSLISIIIVVAMGSIYASLSPVLFIDNFDPLNKEHKMLAALNILEFWNLYVVGVGLSKVWNTTIGKSLGVVGGVWLVWTLIKVFANFGFGM